MNYIEKFIKKQYKKENQECYNFSFIKKSNFLLITFNIITDNSLIIYSSLIFKDNEFYSPILFNNKLIKINKNWNFKKFLRKEKLNKLK